MKQIKINWRRKNTFFLTGEENLEDKVNFHVGKIKSRSTIERETGLQ